MKRNKCDKGIKKLHKSKRRIFELTSHSSGRGEGPGIYFNAPCRAAQFQVITLMKKHRTLTILIVSSIGLFFQMSCSYTYNATSIEKKCIGFEYGKKYMLAKNVFLVKPESEAHVAMFNKEIVVEKDKGHMALTPENSYKKGGGLYKAPETVEDYKKNPIGSVLLDDAYTAIHVLGVVTKGTEIEIAKYQKTVGFSWWWGPVNFSNTYAKILTGEFEGNEVEVDDLGTLFRCEQSEKVLREPDINLLVLKKQ